MTAVRVLLTARARDQIAEAVDRLREEAGEAIAAGLVAELRGTLDRLAAFPAAGSPRLSHELGVPDLRHISLRRFPYLVVYRQLADAPLVVLFPHTRQDYAADLIS